MKEDKRILVLNFGSTSSKIAYFCGEEEVAAKNYDHSVEELKECRTKTQQIPLRRKALEAFLEENQIGESDIDLIVPRYPLEGDENIGHFMADEAFYENACETLDDRFHIMYIAPAVAKEVFGERVPMAVCDVMSYIQVEPELCMTGIPQAKRSNLCHIENTTQISRRLAGELEKPRDELSFAIGHLGGGVSFSWSKGGYVRYCLFDGEGAFSPQRGGIVPSLPLIDLCYSGQYSREEMISLIKGRGGLTAYLGTADCVEVEQRIAGGDEQAKLVYDAMIDSMSACLGDVCAIASGNIDCIVLSGGIANSDYVVSRIKDHVGFIAPVRVYPGEFEMEFFAGFGLDVLNGTINMDGRRWSEL